MVLHQICLDASPEGPDWGKMALSTPNERIWIMSSPQTEAKSCVLISERVSIGANKHNGYEQREAPISDWCKQPHSVKQNYSTNKSKTLFCAWDWCKMLARRSYLVTSNHATMHSNQGCPFLDGCLSNDLSTPMICSRIFAEVAKELYLSSRAASTKEEKHIYCIKRISCHCTAKLSSHVMTRRSANLSAAHGFNV